MRLGHAIHQFDAGLPAEVFLDLRVVTIAPIDSFGRIQLVLAFEFQRSHPNEINLLVASNVFVKITHTIYNQLEVIH